MDDVLLLAKAHRTFLLGFSLSGLGDVQEAGLEDSMEGLVWAKSWEKLPVRAGKPGNEEREQRERKLFPQVKHGFAVLKLASHWSGLCLPLYNLEQVF